MDRPEFWTDGLRFTCTRCSHCCRHESGFVFLSTNDLDHLAQALAISPQECIERYCRWVPFGAVDHLSLREQPNKDCVFWRDGGCSVYEARPTQCRTYPFWSTIVDAEESWRREASECPGIGIGGVVKPEEIEARLGLRVSETPIIRTGGSR